MDIFKSMCTFIESLMMHAFPLFGFEAFVSGECERNFVPREWT